MLWLIFAGMIAVALGFLLLPLWHARAEAPQRAAYDLEVYRDQLVEVAREQARGLLGETEAANARTEIERRMLRAGEELKHDRVAAPRARLASAVVVAIAVPAAALLLYLRLGQPGVPDQPFAERQPPATVADGGRGGQIADMVHRLAERLKANPNDPDGWMLLGRSYLVVKRYDDAVAAYRKAAELSPKDADAHMAYGEAQVFAADGTVTPGAEAAFRQTLAIDAKHPGGRYYLALERQQAGDNQAALDGWLALAADSPPDAPWRPALKAQLEHVAALMHVKLPEPLPSSTAMAAEAPAAPPASAAPPGPNAADMQAAAQMPADDRNQMIRAMVQRLADRLQSQPDDFDGWMRLARAYQVLGESDKAKDALAHAQKLKPGDPAVDQALAAPAAAPAAPAVSAPPPGPSAAEMQAAAQMPADDRNQMIRAMVQRLADRLQSQPDDFDGWMRLARAYQVLGEADKASDALARARKLKPGDPALKQAEQAPPSAHDAPAASSGGPGPTVEQMQAAQDMTPDQRVAMIGGMVQQLADRLQHEPGDFDGWLKLGRAYQVLGRHEDASAAFGKAAALRPNDPAALLARATALVEENGDDKPMPPAAETLFRQVLAMDPDSVDALWYVGMAELQAGRPEVAAAHWRRLLAKLDPKSPDYAEVAKALTGVDKAAAAKAQ
jgi:cytochrome c-type biogenesis protein CcmH